MTTVGPLVLLSRIAAGSLGDVFFARGRLGEDARETDLVAKIIKPELVEDPRFLRLLLSETPSALALRHRAAVRVLAIDRADSEFFVAMEHIHGQPLSIVLKRAQITGEGLDPRAVAWIGAEIAALLHEVHASSWALGHSGPRVHGALAPRSVLVTYAGQPKLLGLPFSRARLSLPVSSSRLAYTAPEVLQGKEVGPKADIFSLGVLLHDALASQPAFRRGTDEDTRRAILECRGAPVDPEVIKKSPPVAELIAQMLQPTPEARPADLGAIERALRGATQGTDSSNIGALSMTMRELFEGEIEFDRRAFASMRRPRQVRGPGSAPTHPEEEPTSPGFSVLAGTEREGVLDSTNLDLARRRIARYHTLAIVARSPGQISFHATDPHLGRGVLLKVMDPRAFQQKDKREELIAAFKREARLVGRLEHPWLPTVYDAGRQGELYFMAYAWVEGEPLSSQLEQHGRLPSSKVHRIALDLAEALDHMHKAGLLCCDLRPSTLLIDEKGRPRFPDLPFASEIGGFEHPLLSSTRILHAPEYVIGGEYSAASDLFALGNLLYQLLTGVRPFLATDDEELARVITDHNPLPPIEVEPDIDPLVSNITMRLLEKDPTRRYPSSADVVSALSSGLNRDTAPGDIRARAPSRVTLPGRPEVSALDPETLAWSLVAALERSLTMSLPMDSSSDGGPIDIARSMARSARLGRREEVLGALTLAVRGLAARMRLSPSAEAIVSLIPLEVLPVMKEVETVVSSTPGSRVEVSKLSQILVVVERYFAATRPTDGRPAVAPRAALRALREDVGVRFSEDVLDALVERVREFDPGVEVGRTERLGKKLLLMGERLGTPLVQALAHAGFEIERTHTNNEAWSRIQCDRFVGTIVEQRLPLRDALSLLKLCRGNPGTRELPFIILTSESDPSLEAEVARAGSAEILERSAATDLIRMRVQHLMR